MLGIIAALFLGFAFTIVLDVIFFPEEEDDDFFNDINVQHGL